VRHLVKELVSVNKDLRATLLEAQRNLTQETAQLGQCLTISWSWEACGLTAIIVLLADRLIRPLWVRYTGREYFLDT